MNTMWKNREIASLIPHREPMVLVDQVLSMEDFEIITSYRIKADNIFLEKQGNDQNQFFSEMGLLENVAQTSYLFIRLYFEKQYTDKEPPASVLSSGSELGFISGIQHLEIFGLPAIGDTISTQTRTTLDYTSDFLKICSIEGTVRINERVLLSTTMKMLLKTEQS